jgi:hypothetical protein
MRYKAEVVVNKKIVRDFYFKDKSHPNQIARSVVQSLKKQDIDFFIILIINEIGDLWRISVFKRKDNKFHVRIMDKHKDILNRNDIDLIFTGNRTIGETF